jgi:hypothetical protein
MRITCRILHSNSIKTPTARKLYVDLSLSLSLSSDLFQTTTLAQEGIVVKKINGRLLFELKLHG